MKFVLHGGLGNLLIQLAAGNKLKKENDIRVEFFSSWIRKRLPHEKLAYNLISDVYEVNIKSGFYSLFNELEFRFLKKFFPGFIGVDISHGTYLNQKILKGYYQSSDFWINGAAEILDYIDLGCLIKDVPSYDMVVHLRGGDYLKSENSGIHKTLDQTLIVRFYDLCKKKNSNKEGKLKVVTDDPAFAHELLSGLDVDIICTDNVLHDFSILANAKNLLTSQSSFSVLAGLYSNSKCGNVFSSKDIGDSFEFDYFKLPWKKL